MRDVYIAIMVASARDKGLNLTPDECDQLSLDEAISQRALNALALEEAHGVNLVGDRAWAKIDPRKEREAGNYGTTAAAVDRG